MNKHILEILDIVPAVIPIALTSARTGDVVSMKNFGRCAIVLVKDAGGAGEDLTITLEQATSVAPSNAKALNFTTIYLKQGASLAAVETWAKVTQAAGNTYTNTDLGGEQALIVIDVKAEDLDADNGYDCIRLSLSDVGSVAQLGAALYFPYEPRYVMEGGFSAIVD